MMLNFMIAVIEDTYGDVDNVKQYHIMYNKAELNRDYFQLIKYFINLRNYRILVFST